MVVGRSCSSAARHVTRACGLVADGKKRREHQRTIARWESETSPTTPGDRYQLLLAHVYARTAVGLKLGPGSDFAKLLDTFRLFGTAPQRVRELVDHVFHSVGHTGADQWTILAPTLPGDVDEDVLIRLRSSVMEINGRVGTTPFSRLQLNLAPIVESCRRLLRLGPSRAHDELEQLATTTYSLAARIAFEIRDDETAMALYIDAAHVAGRLNDRSHQVAVLTSHAMVTLHATGDLKSAAAIARDATLAAHAGANYAVRARAYAIYAEICARAGRAGEAATALDKAWKTVDQQALDDPHGGFNSDRLRAFDGLCALYGGDARRAHDRLTDAASALTTSRDAVQQGIVGTDLAIAKLRLGDPAACVDLLHEAVDITAATGGRVSAQRIGLARRDLRPWRSENFLHELDDHIYDTLIEH